MTHVEWKKGLLPGFLAACSSSSSPSASITPPEEELDSGRDTRPALDSGGADAAPDARAAKAIDLAVSGDASCALLEGGNVVC